MTAEEMKKISNKALQKKLNEEAVAMQNAINYAIEKMKEVAENGKTSIGIYHLDLGTVSLCDFMKSIRNLGYTVSAVTEPQDTLIDISWY